MLHIVRWSGPFGFLKPWTAVRDAEIYSQTFLTPSVLEGLRQKLGVSAILRHRLHHLGLSRQQEQVQSSGWAEKKEKGSDGRRQIRLTRGTGVLVRGVLLRPTLCLAFATFEEAVLAAEQHICLCRNEDVLLPLDAPEVMTDVEFDRMPGIEFIVGEGPDSALVGYNRFERDAEGRPAPMVGRIVAVPPFGEPSGR